MNRLSLILFPLLILGGCVLHTTPRIVPTPVVQRDWSQWKQPKDGTPVILRVFYGRKEVIDLAGAFGYEDMRVGAVVHRELDRVVRVELIFQGVVLGAKNFPNPTRFDAGLVIGWSK